MAETMLQCRYCGELCDSSEMCDYRGLLLCDDCADTDTPELVAEIVRLRAALAVHREATYETENWRMAGGCKSSEPLALERLRAAVIAAIAFDDAERRASLAPQSGAGQDVPRNEARMPQDAPQGAMARNDAEGAETGRSEQAPGGAPGIAVGTPLDLAALDRLAALEQQATPAPWGVTRYSGGFDFSGPERVYAGTDERYGEPRAIPANDGDARYIAALRNHAPALIALARAGLAAEQEIVTPVAFQTMTPEERAAWVEWLRERGIPPEAKGDADGR